MRMFHLIFSTSVNIVVYCKACYCNALHDHNSTQKALYEPVFWNAEYDNIEYHETADGNSWNAHQRVHASLE